MRVNKLLLFPDPADSAGAAGAPSVEPVTAVPQSATAPAVAPPPAAEIVASGPVTEETLKLRKQLDDVTAEKKRVEQEHASVSDEFKRYKDATEARRETPTTIPVVPGKVEKTPSYRFLRRRG